MLKVTIDAFSGVENPSYLMDDSEADELLRQVTRMPAIAVTEAAGGFDGLGFRGATVESLSDTGEPTFDLPRTFRVGAGGTTDDGNGYDVAERLIRGLSSHTYSFQGLDPDEDDSSLVDYLLGLLRETSELVAPERLQPVVELFGANKDFELAAAVSCGAESGPFRPGFWNDPSVVRLNNCYNYASGIRTNTFAQVGRGANSPVRAMTCAEVSRAGFADGLHTYGDCFPAWESPRFIVAMVIAPQHDYHWYRLHTEGFWGHKPGQGAARNVDNSGRIISDPARCDRGGYSSFCGYFFTSKTHSARVR